MQDLAVNDSKCQPNQSVAQQGLNEVPQRWIMHDISQARLTCLLECSTLSINVLKLVRCKFLTTGAMSSSIPAFGSIGVVYHNLRGIQSNS